MSGAAHTPGEQEPRDRPPGPGHLLRNARESRGMGLREVAAQLHLDERTVASLEHDDFADLPAPTFVRGYLRGYARLLGVPVGPVMEAYDREGFQPPELVADIAEKPQARSGDFPVRLVTYLIVAGLAALVVVWWQNQRFDELGSPIATDEAPPPSSGAPGADAATATASDAPDPRAAAVPRAADTAPQREPEPETPATSPGAEAALAGEPAAPPPPAVPEQAASEPPRPPLVTSGQPEAGAPRAGEATASAAEGLEDQLARAEQVLERARAVEETVAAPQAASDPGPPPSAAAGDAESPDPTAAAEPELRRLASVAAAEPATGSGRLRMRFEEESWVEVYDARGERLYFNLVKPGRELDLEGQVPIRVLLGRSRAAQVQFNGQPFDLGPYTERGVARFTVGQ